MVRNTYRVYRGERTKTERSRDRMMNRKKTKNTRGTGRVGKQKKRVRNAVKKKLGTKIDKQLETRTVE